MIAEKLRKATFKHVEAELRAYPDTKKEIEKRREELMYMSDVDENVGAGKNSYRTPTKPTERIATRLTMDMRLRSMEEIVEAIESVLEKLDHTQRKLVELRYFRRYQEMSWEGIALECNIHVQTAFKYRRMIIEAIAERLGWR